MQKVMNNANMQDDSKNPQPLSGETDQQLASSQRKLQEHQLRVGPEMSDEGENAERQEGDEEEEEDEEDVVEEYEDDENEQDDEGTTNQEETFSSESSKKSKEDDDELGEKDAAKPESHITLGLFEDQILSDTMPTGIIHP